MEKSAKLRKIAMEKLDVLEARLNQLESRTNDFRQHNTPGQVLKEAYDDGRSFNYAHFLKKLIF